MRRPKGAATARSSQRLREGSLPEVYTRSSPPHRRSAGHANASGSDVFAIELPLRRDFMRRYQWHIGAILVLLAGVLGLSLFASGATRAQTVDTRGPQTKPA